MSLISAIWLCTETDGRIEKTLDRYLDALSSLADGYELTIVVNGAAQDAVSRLVPLLREKGIASTVVSLTGRCDDSTAIQSGMCSSHGDVIVILPSYVQSDPSSIGAMLNEIEDGADYVASWRNPRIDTRWNIWKSAVFNTVARALSGLKLHDLNSGLRVMRREVAEEVPIYGDLHRYWPILAAGQGFRVTEVVTRHLEERVEQGDYRLTAYLQRIFDLLTLFFLTKFTRKPLRFFGMVGGLALGSGSIITAVLGIQRILGKALADRPMLVFGVLLVVLGIQLVSLGLLGELIIFTHGRRLREYHVDKVFESEGTARREPETEAAL